MRVSAVYRCSAKYKNLWIKPNGFDTGIKIYNCILKEKVPLIVNNKDLVTWYTCGPTVYDMSHIGHASCYVKLDIIQRILRSFFNLNIVTVMNVTDIDDKIIQKSIDTHKSPIEIARFYENEFWKDIESLNVIKPNIVVRVTENINIITNYIQKLLDDKMAYYGKDNSIYFDTTAYSGYGKLVTVNTENIEEKSSVKKSPMDFVLWKAAKSDEIFWDSKFGHGRPGWHIECSTIASTILGSSIDIHAGGLDLKFPHHENEEAQSCSYFKKKQWVNNWIHTGQLLLKDTKMSKSLKNTISIQDLLNTTDADSFRMACLLSNYRNNMEFNKEFLLGAKVILKSYRYFLSLCNAFIKGQIKAAIDENLLLTTLNTTTQDIEKALKDDFDTASAIKHLNKLVNVANKMLNENQDTDYKVLSGVAPVFAVVNFVVDLLDKFGIHLSDKQVQTSNNNIIDILVNFRQDIRALGLENKDKNILRLCDNVRDELKNCSIVLNDRGKQSTWSSQ